MPRKRLDVDCSSKEYLREKQRLMRLRAKALGESVGGIEPRFWARVRRGDGCWEWQGQLHRGYGRIVFRCQALETHRVSWILAHGPIPNGLWVLHHCDNRKCVRPDHLFLGDIRDNTRDRDRKGRQARGERMPMAKLTASLVRKIRRLRRAGMTYTAIGAVVDIHKSAVAKACTGQTWRHVTGDMEAV